MVVKAPLIFALLPLYSQQFPSPKSGKCENPPEKVADYVKTNPYTKENQHFNPRHNYSQKKERQKKTHLRTYLSQNTLIFAENLINHVKK